MSENFNLTPAERQLEQQRDMIDGLTRRVNDLERALESACGDLNGAHDELLKAQGVPPDQTGLYDWPEWSGPANTIRWAGRLLGKHLGKSRATAPMPNRQD